jgi:predicted phage terminase large subunit-like protein
LQALLTTNRQRELLRRTALLRLGNVGTYACRLDDYDETVIAVDTALETGEANDYTACVVLGRTGRHIHVLQVEQHRMAFSEQLMLVRQLTRAYPAAHVLVEAANAGVALIQELRRRFSLHVSPASARRSKEQRAVAVAPLLENGDILFPTTAEWLDPFTRELRTFPHGAHDDMADAFVHGLTFLKRHIDRATPRPFPAPDAAARPARLRPLGKARPWGAVRRR